MGRKAKYSKGIKIQAVLDYQTGKKSMAMISNEIGCGLTTLKN